MYICKKKYQNIVSVTVADIVQTPLSLNKIFTYLFVEHLVGKWMERTWREKPAVPSINLKKLFLVKCTCNYRMIVLERELSIDI